MTVISELTRSLYAIGLEQYVFAFAFLTGYMLALGRWFGARGRLRAALVALLAAVGFSAMTDPWIHGAMLVLLAVAGLGVFISAAWALSRVLALGGGGAVAPSIDPAAPLALPAVRSPVAKLSPRRPTTQSA